MSRAVPLRLGGLGRLDQGGPTGARVRLAAGRAVAFFLDPNPTATSLMLTSEHGSLAVLGGLRHPELLPER
jgi:hypothetical protein